MITDNGLIRIKEGARNASKSKHNNCVTSYYVNPNVCGSCGKVLPFEKRHNSYCNHSCAATRNNLGITRNGHTHFCLVCGKKTDNPKYSCQDCSILSKLKEKENQIERGLISNRPTLKRYIIKRDGYKCSVCGITEWCGLPVVLILDHIDGNSSNNLPVNLRCVCSNCDANLPTYKSKNKGNGREYRRQQSTFGCAGDL